MQNLFTYLFLASEPSVSLWVFILAIVVIAVGGFVLGWFLKNNSFKKKQGDIEKLTAKMLDDAREESKAIKKEAILEAKEQEIKLRSELEREIKEKRAELASQQNRLNQKEESFEKKEDALNRRNEETTKMQNALKAKEVELEKKLGEISAQHDLMVKEFEKIAQMSKEEAKQKLIESIVDEAKRDAAGLVRNIEAEAKENGERKAKKSLALQFKNVAQSKHLKLPFQLFHCHQTI